MPTIDQICRFLEELAPVDLAEDWDNVGLLVGDRGRQAQRVMTCLTVTPDSAAEAIQRKADLVISHHPMPFHSIKRLTADSTAGKILWDLIGGQISIYSPHTAFDSSAHGINQQLAIGLGLTQLQPIVPHESALGELGSGRYGRCADSISLADLMDRTKRLLSIDKLRFVGNVNRRVNRVGVACGSAGQFLGPARTVGCDVLVTGETNFHTCLEAEAIDVSLVLTGHYASERFAVETLSEDIGKHFTDVEAWASKSEHCPINWA